jgi:hypothetical protein
MDGGAVDRRKKIQYSSVAHPVFRHERLMKQHNVRGREPLPHTQISTLPLQDSFVCIAVCKTRHWVVQGSNATNL